MPRSRYSPPRLTVLPPRRPARPPLRQLPMLRTDMPALPIAAPKQASAPATVEGPYQHFSRRFTAEGGIAITYRDIEGEHWDRLVRIAICCVATPLVLGMLHPLAFHQSVSGVVTVGVIIAILTGGAKPRRGRLEVRPDCMILDGTDVFWLAHMELGWPELKNDGPERVVMTGVYGTRFVEYLALRRADEYDRAPEVFAAHLQAAFQQLWNPLGTDDASGQQGRRVR